jgi:excisionase family DNA binding protein
MKHTTMSGHHLEVADDRRDVIAFLARLEKMLGDRKATENDMIALAYGRENPILDHTIFPERGAVTREILADHAYQVVADLVARKRLAQDGVDPEQLAAEYTITVPEAAERLGVHENAVRQAIAARRLASWVKAGRHYMHPRSLASFELAARGPKPTEDRIRAGAPLEVRLGNKPGSSFRVKHDGIAGEEKRVGQHEIEFTLGAWRKIGVMLGRGETQRLFVLEPADEENEVRHGDFYVKGKFRVAKKLNNARIASEAWKAWGK